MALTPQQIALSVQLDLMDEVRKVSNTNMVTCGNCGTILLHQIDIKKIGCYGCGREMWTDDCPDYFYSGMPELDEQ